MRQVYSSWHTKSRSAVPDQRLEKKPHVLLRMHLSEELVERRTDCGRIIRSARRARDAMFRTVSEQFTGAEINGAVADAEKAWIVILDVIRQRQKLCAMVNEHRRLRRRTPAQGGPALHGSNPRPANRRARWCRASETGLRYWTR